MDADRRRFVDGMDTDYFRLIFDMAVRLDDYNDDDDDDDERVKVGAMTTTLCA